MGEARIYEDIQDYEAAKALFDEVEFKKKKCFSLIMKISFCRFLQNIMNKIVV